MTSPRPSPTTRLARWSARHPAWALSLWLAFVAASIILGGQVGTREATGTELGVGESQRADEIVREGAFADPVTDNVLITPATGAAWSLADAEAAAADVATRLEGVPAVHGAAEPVASQHADALLVPLTFAPVEGGEEAEKAAAEALPALEEHVAAVASAHPGLRVELVGGVSIEHGVNELVDADLNKAGMLSLPVTLVILLLAFGTIIAAGVPLLLALTAVASAFGLWGVASQVFPDAGSTMHVILLVGMAVGVDYSLFYLKREREERAAGRGHLDAVAVAAETSGRSVVVSGVAVIVSMAGLYLADDAVFNGLATGAILVVAVAMLGSLTVLPAILAKLGHRVDRPRVPFVWRLTNRAYDAAHRPRLWPALLKPALKAPRTTLVIALAAMAALAYFATGLEPKNSEIDDFPADLSFVQAHDRLTTAFPSEGKTHIVAVKAPASQTEAVRAALADLYERTDGDALFSHEPEPRIETSADGTVTTLAVPVPFQTQDPRARESLDRLRGDLVPRTVGALDGAEAAVTGGIASDADYVDHQREKLPLVIGFVVLLTFLMMAVAFRSVVVALVAAVLNLLSAVAAFGVLVLVFQYEWAEPLLDFQSNGHVVTWIPLFLFVILFGLSMDYHVFVVSRIREAAEAGIPTRQAVAYGITRTAGVVTSAAFVMVGVFAVFAVLSMQEMKQMGVGLAVAILLDATIVRIFLLPSIMALLGRANWWPSRLSRRAPAPEPAAERVPVGAAP